MEHENLDAQDGWRHPVPALMTHVLVPLEKSTSRLSCLSYKICLHNVQLHPTHAIPHPRHLDRRDKRHLKRLPTERLLWRRHLVFGKRDRKKLLHMQCMFLSHFKHVLTPVTQPAFFTSGQTKQTLLSQLPQIPVSRSFIMLGPCLLHKWHHVWGCLHKVMTLGEFFWGYVGTGMVPRAWSSPWHTQKHCGTGASMFGNMRYSWYNPLGTWVTRLYWKHQVRSSWAFWGSKEVGGWRWPWNSPCAISHGPGRGLTTQSFTHPEGLETLQKERFWAACPGEVVKYLRTPWFP